MKRMREEEPKNEKVQTDRMDPDLCSAFDGMQNGGGDERRT